MLNEIETETNKIYQKQSWVRKSTKELLKNMSEKLDLDDGNVKVRKSLSVCHKIDRDMFEWYSLTFENGKFYIECDDPDYEQNVGDELYDKVDVDDLNAGLCRNILIAIPSALQNILESLKELNNKYDEAEKTLDKLNKCLFE